MPIRPSNVLLAVILAFSSIGVSTLQRSGSATADATGRVVSAAEAFLATLNPGQRAKVHLDLNEKTRTVWSNLPSGITMQVGATERNGLKLGDMTPARKKPRLPSLRPC
jgi:Protein of unknown function (DUF3500)